MPKGSTTPWSYILVRFLFKFVLKIFYGTIVVENADLIPKTGQPCIVCANHSNSLTDALLLVSSMPSKTRNMLRLTAKSTQFGHRTFTSWLIESAGTVPIKRRKDFDGNQVDNTQVMDKLMEALELGDAVCLFPEGASRYHPTIAPLKTGVARILSDVLSRNRDDPNFSVSILTCSITYMHRQHFRSDVLVTFNPPMTFTPKDNPELLTPVQYDEIRTVTSLMQQQISSRTIDSPSWEIVRSAKMATRIYAPFGTRMSLGDYVRVTRTFVEAFKASGDTQKVKHSVEDQTVDFTKEDAEFNQLRRDLKDYQDLLVQWGITDDRITHPLSRRMIMMRMVIRLAWSIFLFTISFPGLVLWTPVFATTYIAVRNFKKTGPVWDTWDEIAQYKLVYGLFSGLSVWIACIVFTLPSAVITSFLVPALMWMTLRWMEDAVSAFRAFMALARLLCVGKKTLNKIRTTRRELHVQLMNLAVGTLGLPDDPERSFVESGVKQKGRVRSKWDSGAKYFSVKRRRKRDWNETLRLYDQVDYPEEEL